MKCVDWRRRLAYVHQMDQQFTSQQSMKTFQICHEGGCKWSMSKELMKWNQLLELIWISLVIPDLWKLDQTFINIWNTRSEEVHQGVSSWYRILITCWYKMNLSSEIAGLWRISNWFSMQNNNYYNIEQIINLITNLWVKLERVDLLVALTSQTCVWIISCLNKGWKGDEWIYACIDLERKLNAVQTVFKTVEWWAKATQNRVLRYATPRHATVLNDPFLRLAVSKTSRDMDIYDHMCHNI